MVTMAEHIWPLTFVVVLWFVSTGLIFWLDSRPARTFASSLGFAGLFAIGAVVALAATVDNDGISAAYIAFVAALTIWGWHEMSFLTGVVTGPNKGPCPGGARGWARFKAAAATLIHHEIALALTAVLLFALAWGHSNMLGAQAFALLFAFRLSAKLNIFLGVPAFVDEMLPPHLAYLRSYFVRAPLNPLLPFSLVLSLGAAAWFASAALAADGGAAVANSLLFALAALGLIEHLFLILPLHDAALWRWARASSAAKTATTD